MSVSEVWRHGAAVQPQAVPAGVLRRLGELEAACDAHQRALAIREARLSPDHPHRARALSSLGSVAYQLGELPTARTCY